MREGNEEKAGTANVPETAEEARVLDDEELTRIVGGTGNNEEGENNEEGDNNEEGGTVFSGYSPGPSWD